MKLELIDISTIQIEGIEMNDYPDFCDAFITYAGQELNDSELDELNEEHYDIINELIHDNQLYL